MSEMLPLELQIEESSIIKVIGVGGGGCNAVNYMYQQGIKDVTFLVCNTDKMALQQMSVPAKLQLGTGLGAGGRPEVAEEFANSSLDKINEALDDGTRMVFITAGMGGGTGTGASPVVAREAQKKEILTVGIVTIPFAFEGKKAIRKALRGVAKLAEHTDALLIINNEKLKLLFPDFDLPVAFAKADEVVCKAAKSISEIITVPGYINIDFQDVYNTLKNGDVAIMNEGRASGDNRITAAIEEALNSPLINNRDVHGASRVLMNFYCSKEHAILMKELEQVSQFCDSMGDDVDVRWGTSYDDSLGEEVRVTIIATGYKVNDIPGMQDAIEYQDEEVEAKKEKNPPIKSIDEAIKAFYDKDSDKNNNQDKENQHQQETSTESDDDTQIGDDEELEIVINIGGSEADEPIGNDFNPSPTQPNRYDDQPLTGRTQFRDADEIEIKTDDVPSFGKTPKSTWGDVFKRRR